jgi:cytochrome c biogenesis factor
MGVSLVGAHRGRAGWMALCGPAYRAVQALVGCCLRLLTAFVDNDFSVL